MVARNFFATTLHMKTKNWLLLGFFGLSLCFSSFAQDPSQWTSGWVPYFRHVRAVEILQNDKLVVVGGWESNDAISSIFTSADTGANWNIEMDMVNAWLQDVDFPGGTTGYTVGWAGNIWKSTDEGDNWSQITVPGSAGTRNYNGCYFFDNNTGIVVGGNESNDAIQTILRTTDGGTNWSVISDNLAPWLRAVHFANANTGYTVGDAGTILKTTDGGINWSALSMPGSTSSRQFNDVHFVDANTGIAVGGWPDNDSIRTILKTTDGGANWSIISDNLGSMLTGVHFFNATQGYAVGDDGLVLYTGDAGSTWQEQTIPVNNLAYHNYDVMFKDAYFGLVGGNSGKLMIYVDGNATLADGALNSPVTVINSNSVFIEGWVDDLGLSTSLELEYGTTLAFGASEPMTPNTSSGSGGVEQVEVVLNGLTADEIYFARMKMTNAVGTSYSNTVTFFTGVSAIPNFNFELWDEFTFDVVNDWWSTTGATQATSYNASLAVELSQSASGELGAIIHGTAGQMGPAGGVPFTERPDSLTFWANYNISAGDSALVFLQFKNNGTPIADTIYQIWGTSAGWEYISLGIDYTSGINPDSVLIAFTNSDIFDGNNDPNSTITIDNVLFVGSTQQLPNNGFESWSQQTRMKASDWVSNDDQNDQTPYVVEQSTDSYSGSYALKLSNYIGSNYSDFGRLRSGDDLNNWYPSFEVNHNHDTLFGFVKYFPSDNDTLFIRVNLFEAGAQIGYGDTAYSVQMSNYNMFAIPIQYWMGGTADSCLIDVSIYKNNGMGPGTTTYAIIDNLSFDAIILPTQEASLVELEDVQAVTSYPNPTNGPITIEFKKNPIDPVRLMVVDLNGRVLIDKIQSVQNKKINLDLSNLNTQYYYILVAEGNQIHSIKTFVK